MELARQVKEQGQAEIEQHRCAQALFLLHKDRYGRQNKGKGKVQKELHKRQRCYTKE